MNALSASVSGLSGTIKLADLLQIALPQGSLANIKLDMLDFVTGAVQLYNFNYHLIAKWEGLAEYRWLKARDGGDKSGWLIGLQPRVNAHGRGRV